MSQEPPRITIGPRWSSFTYPREDMQLLGIVQRGMQIGALARMPDGSYAQVNGDVIAPINRSCVEFALRSAAGTRARASTIQPLRTAPSTIVTIKKRRRVAPLPTTSGSDTPA